MSARPKAAANIKTELGNLPHWNLDDLFEGRDSPAFRSEFDSAIPDAAAFETSAKGKLATLSGDELATIIEAYERLQDRLGRMISYAFLNYAGDSTDTANTKFFGDVQERMTDAGRHLLFFGLELNRIADAAMDAKLAESTRLARYRPWIEDARLERPYELADDLERLFMEKQATGAGAFNRLFDDTMTGLRFDVDGEELAIEPTLTLLTDRNRKLRKAASQALSKTFGENLRLFTLITNTLAKDKRISDEWRGFGDVAASRHLANRVEAETVDALVSAVEAAFPDLSHRYYALKAKWLGLDVLETWDRNAPLPMAADRRIGWEEARTTVLDAYRGFAPEMATIAGDFFERRWIDAPVAPGKAPGAFAHPTVPSAHPYVLLNYQGKPRDVMTLAHELGHGVHQVLAAEQGALMASTPLTLAETASVFGEMLTFKALLAQAKSPTERKAMLAQKVEDMINTVVRQIAFYMFERKVHEARREGEMTSQQIGELWMSVQESSLGPSVKLREGYENFWTYIPHFIHSPFYVYAYAFGDCLVNSLYATFEKGDPAFVGKYFDMLKAGGTKHHSELLAPFGLDATDPAFWQRGLSVISSMIDELEALDAAGA